MDPNHQVRQESATTAAIGLEVIYLILLMFLCDANRDVGPVVCLFVLGAVLGFIWGILYLHKVRIAIALVIWCSNSLAYHSHHLMMYA